MHRRPRSHMKQLPLMKSMILQQRIKMLPARQRAYPPNTRINHIQQRIPRAIPKDGTFHMRGFKLATLRLDLSIVGYKALRDVERSVIVF